MKILFCFVTDVVNTLLMIVSIPPVGVFYFRKECVSIVTMMCEKN